MGVNMFKNVKNISINILTVLIVLFTLLTLSISVGNAWFTSAENRGFYVIMDIGQLNLKLYQTIDSKEYEIFTNSKNEKQKTSNYVKLSGEILPEQFTDLNLTLKNEDEGIGTCIRFKFEVYACDNSGNSTLLPVNLTLGENIVQNGDYYCYGVNEDSFTYTKFNKSESLVLFTGFTLPFSSYEMVSSGETIKVALTIEAGNTF